MDLILSHQAGFRNTIATSGTALSDSVVSKTQTLDPELKEHVVSSLGLIRRMSNNIVLGFDGDTAGVNATKRAGKIALSLGMDVKVAMLPEGMDPADLIVKKGPEAWKEAIKNSKHVVFFILDKVIEQYGNDIRKTGKAVKDSVLPFVHDMDSSIEKSFFLKKVSDMTGISIHALQDDLASIAQTAHDEKREVQKIEENEREMFRKDYILRRLLGILFWQETLPKGVGVVDVLRLRKELSEELDVNLEQMRQVIDNKEDYIFEAEVFYTNNDFLMHEVDELLNNLKQEYAKEELAHKVRELARAEESKDPVRISKTLQEYQHIINTIEQLKNSRTKR
jgi:DNA primase